MTPTRPGTSGQAETGEELHERRSSQVPLTPQTRMGRCPTLVTAALIERTAELTAPLADLVDLRCAEPEPPTARHGRRG